MNSLYFYVVTLGSLVTWYCGLFVRKEAKVAEKWIVSILILLSVGFTLAKKYNISITMPSEFFIRWIAPWVQQLMTKE